MLDTTISPPGIYRRITIASAYIPRAVLNELWNDDKFNILGDKSFADDLNLERGIVRCREVLLPRSAEIHPLFFDLFNYVCMYTLKTSMHIYLIGPPPPNLQTLTQSHTINTCTTTHNQIQLLELIKHPGGTTVSACHLAVSSSSGQSSFL